ncbi:argininosuccinate synthetase, partial [Linnemannia schmuckeri]
VRNLRDQFVTPQYSNILYNGQYFSPEAEFLLASIAASQKTVNGEVRLKLYKGNVIVEGRSSKTNNLYDMEESSMDVQGGFSPIDSEGFIKIQSIRLKKWGLNQKLALASLPSLKEYLQDRNDIGHDPDSITQALYETIEMLNVIYRRPTSKRLVKMVKTVKAKAAHVLTSQQQDAQELFQILSSQLSEEREKVDHATTLSKANQAGIGLCNNGLVTVVIDGFHTGESE